MKSVTEEERQLITEMDIILQEKMQKDDEKGNTKRDAPPLFCQLKVPIILINLSE